EKKKMSELESKINSTSGAADALRDQLKREKAELEARVKKLEEELAASRAENAQLKNRIRELETGPHWPSPHCCSCSFSSSFFFFFSSSSFFFSSSSFFFFFFF